MAWFRCGDEKGVWGGAWAVHCVKRWGHKDRHEAVLPNGERMEWDGG